jgi:hypothetical protein
LWASASGTPGTLLVVSAVMNLVWGGYFLRFYLDCTISSLEGAESAPEVPSFQIGEFLKTGLKGVGITAVYVLPLVTLPLLPVALMALAYTGDGRAFNVLHVARAALRRPGALLLLWLAMLVFLALTVVGVLVAATAAAAVAVPIAGIRGVGGFFARLALIVAYAVVLGELMILFYCACFRSFGLLGKHYPQTLERISKPSTPMLSVVFIVLGLATSAVILSFVAQRGLEAVRPVLDPLHRKAGRGKNSPRRPGAPHRGSQVGDEDPFVPKMDVDPATGEELHLPDGHELGGQEARVRSSGPVSPRQVGRLGRHAERRRHGAAYAVMPPGRCGHAGQVLGVSAGSA